MKRNNGLTLPEILIYVTMALLACLAVGALFILGRSAQQTTVSGYLVSGEADTALRWLRRDLQETALVSIQTYKSPPGCSMVSPRQPTEENPDFQVSKYGKPLWSKHVFYTVKMEANGRTGDLIRWEQPLTAAQKDFVPHPATVLPSSLANLKNKRVLLRNVVAPNTGIHGLQGRPANWQTDQYGGFSVLFVERKNGENGEESYVEKNPAETSSDADSAAHHTRLVRVRLQILAEDRSDPSFYELEFKVHPRY